MDYQHSGCLQALSRMIEHKASIGDFLISLSNTKAQPQTNNGNYQVLRWTIERRLFHIMPIQNGQNKTISFRHQPSNLGHLLPTLNKSLATTSNIYKIPKYLKAIGMVHCNILLITISCLGQNIIIKSCYSLPICIVIGISYHWWVNTV